MPGAQAILIIFGQIGRMRAASFLCLVPLLFACSEQADDALGGDAEIATDPVIARALHDPLMSDPDLAARNQANALIGFTDETALPFLAATPEAARAAREAGRLELLEGGAIPPLPVPAAAVPDLPRANAPAGELLDALGAPQACAAKLSQDFAWAAKLPPVAAIMPQAMVMQAGGADVAPCRLRIVRYQTAASAQDILQYHHTRALRAGLTSAYRAEAPAGIVARGAGGAALVVTVRATHGGLTAVEVLSRTP